MITIDIPDFGTIELHHVVLDFNGTMAVDGHLIDGVAERLEALSRMVDVHVVTADTFGRARQELDGTSCSIDVLPPGNQAEAKLRFVEALGAAHTACYGTGRNDRSMLGSAALGVVVMHEEGAASAAIAEADVVAQSITAALDLLLHPLRLVATLRS
jgi:soluble P-type ATPase